MSDFLDQYLANRRPQTMDDLKSQETRASVTRAMPKNPDQQAQVYDIANKTKLSPDFVENNLSKAVSSTVDYQKIQKETPVLSRYLADRRNADISHDDMDNLAWWETTAKEGKNVLGLIPAATSSVASAGYSILGSGFDLASSLVPGAEPVSFFKKDLGTIGGAFKHQARIQRDLADRLFPTDSAIPTPVLGGVKSAITNLPMLAASVIARNPNLALGAMGAVTFGDSYLKADDAGLDMTGKLAYATTDALAEVMTEKIPAVRMIEDYMGGAGFMKMLGRQMAAEIPGEQVATLIQDLNAWMTLNPEKTLKEFVAERPGAAADTFVSTLVATGLQTSVIAGVQAATREKEQTLVGQLAEKATESKVRGRSTEVFEQHIQDLTDEYESIDSVYINAEDANTLYQGMEEDETRKLLDEQMAEALATNGDIVIPMETFLSTITQSKSFETLKPHVRLSADSPTQKELDDATRQPSDILAAAQKQVQLKTDADEIYQEVTDQLIKTGRLTKDQAKASAGIIPAYVTTRAAAMGLEASEIYNMMGLSIVGPKSTPVEKPAIDPAEVKARITPEKERRVLGTDVADDKRKEDRRTDETRRDKIQGMTPEEQYDVIYRNELTGLNNRRAFDEDIKKAPVVVSVDIDSLKAVNDNLGHGAGDQLLKVASKAIQDATGKAYHISGDEFYILGENQQEIETALEVAKAELSKATVASKKGNLTGVDFTYGTGKDKESADEAMESAKGERETKGERVARGELPKGMDLGEVLKQEEKGGISLLPDSAIIKLTKASNLSTFLHESAHLFLHMEGRLYSHPNATEQMKEDGDAILKFLEAESFDSITTEQHEKWARAQEKYFGEGKAPSVELQSSFRRFASWMKRVYVSLKQLNVNLNDEVRQVMDRMLATEEQINRLKGTFTPLFESAEDAGMTKAEYKAYSSNATADGAKEELQGKLLKELKRHKTKWWKDERTSLQKKIEEQLLESPVYSAEKFLREPEVMSKEEGSYLADLSKIQKEIEELSEESLLSIIKANGGLDLANMQDEGIYFKNFTQAKKEHGDLFKRKGGMSLTQIVGDINERYNQDLTEVDIATLLSDSLAGEAVFLDIDVQQQVEQLQQEASTIVERSAGIGSNRFLVDEIKIAMPGVIPNRLRGLSSEHGSTSSHLTRLFGFASGEEMFREIAKSPTLRKEAFDRAQAEMLERHGDTLNDGTIEEEAQAAMRNADRAKKLLAELRVLSKKTNQPSIDRAALREYARGKIESIPYTQIKPNQYRAAEIRSAREAVAAKSKGDLPGAQRAKTQEVLNFYLGKEAALALHKAEKIRASLKSLQAKKYSATKYDNDYVNKAKQLIAAYDFRKNSHESKELASARLEAVRNWITSQQADPNNIATFVEAEILGKLIPSREMSLNDLTGLNDTVTSIMHAAKLRGEESTAEYKANIEEGRTSIVDNRIETYETEIDTSIPWVKARIGFSEFAASLRKMDSLARQADGMKDQGWVWRNTIKPLLDASNAALKARNKSGEELKELFKGFTGIFNGLHDMKTFTFVSGQKHRMSYGSRISVALNLGNEGNLEALKTMKSLPLTETDINQIISTLSERDWALVQNIWDYVDTYWPQVAELEKSRSGAAPQKVQPRSFTTPDGRSMEGGYYPLAGDPTADTKQLEQDIDTQAKAMMNGGAASKSTKAGSTIERVGFGGKKIDFSINVLFNHIDEVIHDVSHWKAVKDVDRVLKNEKINSQLAVSLSKPGVQAMKTRLNEIAAGPQRIEGLGIWNRSLRYARLAATYGALGYSIRTALINTLGLTTAIAEMDSKKMASATLDYVKSPIEMGKFILSKSVYMQERGQVINRDIAQIRANLRGDSAFTKFKDNAFWMMTQTDKVITRPIWIAAYRDGQVKFNTEQEAIDHADRMVAKTQGSGMDLDLANVETRNELMKTMTVMYSAFSAIYNTSVEQVKKRKAGVTNSYQLAASLAWLTVVPGILAALMTQSDDEDLWEEMLWEIAGQALGMIPVLRDIYSGIRYGSNFPTPVIQLGAAPFELAKQIEQGEIDKGVVRAATGAAALFHIPGGAQANRTIGYLIDLQDGEIDEFSPYSLKSWQGLLLTGKK